MAHPSRVIAPFETDFRCPWDFGTTTLNSPSLRRSVSSGTSGLMFRLFRMSGMLPV